MSVASPSPQPRPPQIDPALQAAWRRFLNYSDVSTRQKKLYRRLRQSIIVIAFSASALAVLSAFTFLKDIEFLSGAIRIMLIILPIAGVGVMTYATQFAAGTTWIEYRVSAERIRSNIYLFRLQAGNYYNKPIGEQRRLLLNAVETADDRIETDKTVPYLKILNRDVTEYIDGETQHPNDDGISPITIQEYLDYRVKPQFSWYVNRIRKDYKRMQQWRITSLVIAGLGSALAGIGGDLVSLVAVTTALGASVSLWMELRMHGYTYNIYHWAAMSIQESLNDWDILSDEQKTDSDTQSVLVDKIENIFWDESKRWRDQAIQAQSSSEEQLFANLSLEGAISDPDNDDEL